MVVTTVSWGSSPRGALGDGAERQDLVAVDGLAGGVDRQHAIAVAVERQAQVGTGLEDGRREQTEVGGPAARR